MLLASLVTIPHRLASHNSVMAAAAALILAMGAGEWLDGLRHRPRTAPSRDWYGATLAGLAWICALTYFFAFLYKLNTAWFSRGSPAPGFLIRSVAPLLDPLGVPGWSARGTTDISGLPQPRYLLSFGDKLAQSIFAAAPFIPILLPARACLQRKSASRQHAAS